MPLKDSNCIDIITRDPDGQLALVITDSGLTLDYQERFDLLVEEVTHYVGYVLSDDFRREYPGLKPRDVKIRVVCAVAPTPEMSGFTRLTNPKDKEDWIGIEYELPESSQLPPELVSNEKNAVPGLTSTPWFKRSVSQWIWVFVCAGLLGSGLCRLVILRQSPLTPLLLLFFLWRLRVYNRRRRWEKFKAAMIANDDRPPN